MHVCEWMCMCEQVDNVMHACVRVCVHVHVCLHRRLCGCVHKIAHTFLCAVYMQSCICASASELPS